jgi:hypothetical protein
MEELFSTKAHNLLVLLITIISQRSLGKVKIDHNHHTLELKAITLQPISQILT